MSEILFPTVSPTSTPRQQLIADYKKAWEAVAHAHEVVVNVPLYERDYPFTYLWDEACRQKCDRTTQLYVIATQLMDIWKKLEETK